MSATARPLPVPKRVLGAKGDSPLGLRNLSSTLSGRVLTSLSKLSVLPTDPVQPPCFTETSTA